ncbi:MAG: CPXCG motif-containing cysteine-rich protein [bacterium]|nr:CPXCG motif-containing cysteine-rich protein [bacterium]
MSANHDRDHMSQSTVREAFTTPAARAGNAFRPTRKRRLPQNDSAHRTRLTTMRGVQAETSYACWACGEEIVIPVEPAEGRDQDYVEDCPVCCRPNRIHVDCGTPEAPRAWSEPES